MRKILGIGGGTGLPVLLGGLKEFAQDPDGTSRPTGISISAIVSTSDDGGSSGRLSRTFGIPAVGDLRNCLAALAPNSFELPELFQHRFAPAAGHQGHSLSNLIVTALCEKSCTLGQAIQTAARLLRLHGHILPVTEVQTTLCAVFEDGSVMRGESQIGAASNRIRRVWLEPESPPPFPGVLEVIANADVIVFGPGSLYTSIIPNLLVEDAIQAIRCSTALKIFICNLTTQPGETEAFTASDHLRVLQSYFGQRVIDICVMSSDPVPQIAGSKTRVKPVRNDPQEIARMGVVPIQAGLLAREGPWVRHDPKKLAQLIVSIADALPRPGTVYDEGGLVA